MCNKGLVKDPLFFTSFLSSHRLFLNFSIRVLFFDFSLPLLLSLNLPISPPLFSSLPFFLLHAIILFHLFSFLEEFFFVFPIHLCSSLLPPLIQFIISSLTSDPSCSNLSFSLLFQIFSLHSCFLCLSYPHVLFYISSVLH